MSRSPGHHPTRARRAVPVAAVAFVGALLLLAAACSSDASTSSAADTPTTVAQQATNEVTITTPGPTFEVSGPLRPGVATITLNNTDTQAHMLAMARLQPGVTIDQVRAALNQSEDAVTPLLIEPPDQAIYGTPAQVGAGQSSTVTAEHLQAGTYALLCFFTDDTGTPHWQMGMMGELTVEGDEFTATPAVDGTITIDDTAITLPAGFDGTGTFEVTNQGTKEHSISMARLDAGVTLDSYFEHIGEAMANSKAVDGGGGVLVGGVDSLLPGQSAILTLDLPAGNYAYVSSVDAEGPQMPAQHGQFEVG
jgi:plastocyanin